MHTDLLAMWFTKLRHSLGQAQLPKFFWFQLTRSEGSSVFSHGSETSKMMSRAWCTDGWGCSICSALESRLAVRDGKRLHITSQKVVWRFGNCNWSILILDGVVLQTSGSPTKAVRASVLEAGVAEARFTKGLIFVAEMLAFVSKGFLCSQTYSIMFYPGSRCRHIFWVLASKNLRFAELLNAA